jgi:hypothetical protein
MVTGAPPSLPTVRSYMTMIDELMYSILPVLEDKWTLLPAKGPVQYTGSDPVPTTDTSPSTVMYMSDVAF